MNNKLGCWIVVEIAHMSCVLIERHQGLSEKHLGVLMWQIGLKYHVNARYEPWMLKL